MTRIGRESSRPSATGSPPHWMLSLSQRLDFGPGSRREADHRHPSLGGATSSNRGLRSTVCSAGICPPAPEKDADVLVTFFDFPAEHWKHLRTSNVIESPFATVR